MWWWIVPAQAPVPAALAAATIESPYVVAPAMWCFESLHNYLFTDAAAREEKSITAVSRDSIPVEEFLDQLKKKRKKGILGIEFKVSEVVHASRALLFNVATEREPLIEFFITRYQ